ncbi:MAG: hypothetical protein CMM58_03340 [Rhodospirillaceae bacterium]|nr:hypothetical protein [Rhodospirillaceae bacterium]|tara:strand:+ start:241 stop:1227 length:987 start_codon:yes stop_codon:yes gene_type:complete
MDTRPDQRSKICNKEICSPLAWKRDSIKDQSWLVELPDDVVDELRDFIILLRLNPVPIEVLDATDYELAHCIKLMKDVQNKLINGTGLAILNKLPAGEFNKMEMKQIYWVLSSLIERPVAQSFDGRLLYDVIDTGAKIATRTRGDLTNQELSWHTDYGFNFPPPFIGLLALNTAPKGGISRVASMLNVHNILRQQYPEYLKRLYRPFWWNRQGEHPEGNDSVHFYPIFSYDGETVRGRYIKWLLYKGYELMGEDFDELGQEALETMFDIMSDPINHITFDLEPGQIQYMNNFAVAHSRTDYRDSKKVEDKRHLVRIFLRNSGRRSYMG